MTLKEVSIVYIGYVVPFSVVIPLLIAIVKYSKLPRELRTLLAYLAVSFLSSIVVSALASRGISNMPVIHLYTLFEFLLIALFYYQVFILPLARQLIIWIAVLYIFFFGIDISYIESINSFNNYSKSVESIIVILLSLVYFILSLDDTKKLTHSYTAITYAVSGMLVYFSSSLVFFIVLNTDPQFIPAQIIIWDIHASFLLLMFMLFSVGLWKYR